jgi:hypothetical protein
MKEAPGENFRQPREYAYTGLQHRTVRGSPLCPRASDVEFSGSICTNFPTVRESSPTVHGVSCRRFNLPLCPRANSAGSKIAVAEIEISLLSARRSLGENSHDTHHRVGPCARRYLHPLLPHNFEVWRAAPCPRRYLAVDRLADYSSVTCPVRAAASVFLCSMSGSAHQLPPCAQSYSFTRSFIDCLTMSWPVRAEVPSLAHQHSLSCRIGLRAAISGGFSRSDLVFAFGWCQKPPKFRPTNLPPAISSGG